MNRIKEKVIGIHFHIGSCYIIIRRKGRQL